DQQVTAVPLHERPLTDPSYAIGDERAEELGDGSHHDDGHDIEVSLGGQHPGEPEGDLRGNRHTARLEAPEQEDRGVAPVDEKALHSTLLYSMISGAPAAGGAA